MLSCYPPNLQQLVWGAAEDWEDNMTTFITQARFTEESFSAMISAPEDRAQIVGRLIAEVGGKLNAYYLENTTLCSSSREHRTRRRYQRLLLRLRRAELPI